MPVCFFSTIVPTGGDPLGFILIGNAVLRPVDCLVNTAFVIQVFHDVNFPSDRPADAVGFGHHPDGRPDALHAIESGADFYVAILEGEGFQGIYPSAGVCFGRCGLVGLSSVVPVFSPQGHGGVAVLFPEFHKAFVPGLVLAPVRGVIAYVINAAPVMFVQRLAVKVVFKNEFPVPVGCPGSRRHDGRC